MITIQTRQMANVGKVVQDHAVAELRQNYSMQGKRGCRTCQLKHFFNQSPTFYHLKIVLKSVAKDWIAKFLASIIYLCRIAGTVLANGSPTGGLPTRGLDSITEF
jgi:hypothetical protein